jgi:ribonuclease HI
LNCVKCNTGGASVGNPGPAACGGIYKNANADFLGAFSINLGVTSALSSELIGAMMAIEIAHQKNWHNFWLETDSMLVYLAFKSAKIVPWHLRNRWDNCMHLLRFFNFNVSRIYREGNHCVDQLANIGFSMQSYSWFHSLPHQISAHFDRNSLGIPNFRLH